MFREYFPDLDLVEFETWDMALVSDMQLVHMFAKHWEETAKADTIQGERAIRHCRIATMLS